MGNRRAAEMLILGKKITAKEALECGFVTDVIENDVLGHVMELCQKLGNSPQESILASKRLLRPQTMLTLLDSVNQAEVSELYKRQSSPEFAESAARLLNLLQKKKSKL
eukprot:TRINITY_DN1570_c0_g1_i3.p1 TRINITY_DN1570_c0_g1~~TRINITY_DN1570_c0_g1_i3.p1  ORF type:complete len:109 (-),score=32.79 TRINITY_DN1570_c0_g1_i3:43-369(-)